MRDKVTDRLSACPFCGATDCVKILKAPELNDEDFDPELDDESYAVNCDAQKGGCGSTGGFSVDVNKAVLKWNNRQAQPDPSPAIVQSAEEYKYELHEAFTAQYGDIDIKVLKLIEADRAAQRQIGREEAKKDYLKAMNDCYAQGVEDTTERYSAVVEALRLANWYINDGSELPTDKNHPYYKVSEAVEKALSDLEPSAPQDAKE